MEFLSQKGIAYNAKDISTDMEARRELVNLGSRSTPTITVDDQVIIGFDRGKLSALLGKGVSTSLS
jgi:glutaredoxin